MAQRRATATRVQGFKTQDGAGVHLVRVLSHDTVKDFDPILMLDSFDSHNPSDYIAGFPLHPHRGIETISYLCRGTMVHHDSAGGQATITDGGVQWMCAGSGIMHEEAIPAVDWLLGVQLWLNMPANEKMCPPAYHGIDAASIPEVAFDGATVRVLAGRFQDVQGHLGDHLPLDYYDIVLPAHTKATLPVAAGTSALAFTLLGTVSIAGDPIREKTAVKLEDGDEFVVENAGSSQAHVLYIASRALGEPVAWGGPIVMNTDAELRCAFDELEAGTFIKEGIDYDAS